MTWRGFTLTPYAGWHLVAFASDLTGDVNPVELGDRPLVAVRQDVGFRIFDATCPHRGAHLGYGGRLDRDCLVCPFHGRRIQLGGDPEAEYFVPEHQSVLAGEALFVRFLDGPDRGFGSLVDHLGATHDVIAAFTIPVSVEAEIVIENAFDPEHFVPVHGVVRAPKMQPFVGPDDELVVSSALPIPILQQGPDGPRVGAWPQPFYARAVSPNLVITRLGPGPEAPYYFTGTIPTPDGCIARVAVAAPKSAAGLLMPRHEVEALIDGSREAFREDMPVWQHLARGHRPRYDSRDAAVMAFREFVAGFHR